MKYRFKTISGVLALTFMLLFGAVSFAHASSRSMANPIMNAAGIGKMGKDRVESHHHHHHRRHHRHRWHR